MKKAHIFLLQFASAKRRTSAIASVLLFSIFYFLFAICSLAQAPQSFNYQLIARDASGLVLNNRTLGIQISILQDASAGAVVYSERHTATSNSYGLVSLAIGTGAVVVGDFQSIDWGAHLHFVKLEIDPAGGTNFFTMGTTQLVSVPYSLYAEKAGNAISVIWLGTLPVEPSNPILNQAYYNSSEKKSYIYDGTSWQIFAQDGLDGATGGVGPQGPQGNQGIQGDQGPAGTGLTNKGNWSADSTYSGGDFVFDRSFSNPVVNSMWICQSVTPFSSALQPYSDLGNWVEFEAPAGPQGATGTTGTNGLDGKTVLNGIVNPTSQGVDGDFYINTSSKMIFGPKTSGAWGGGTSLIGPAGTYTQGTGILISGGSITNTLPDQNVTITGSGAASVTGAYPNFTISSSQTLAQTLANGNSAGSYSIDMNSKSITNATIIGLGNSNANYLNLSFGHIFDNNGSHGTNGQVLTVHGTSPNTYVTWDTPVSYSAGSGITQTGSSFSHTAHTGDVTGATALSISNLAVSTAKLADNSVTGAKIALGSDASGDIIYYNGTDYVRLAKGTDGQVLKLATGLPAWSTDNGLTAALTSLNGLTGATQTFTTGTTGTDFTISSSGTAHTFNIPVASATNAGKLSSTDWTTFNNKLSTSLTSGYMWVGSASNSASPVSMSGDATISNTGVITVANSAISAAKLANNSVTGAKIALGSDAAGDILYYNGTDYVRLAKGADGQILKLSTGLPAWGADNNTITTMGTGLSLAGSTINSVWTQSGNNIFNNNTGNVGVGINAPVAKMVVQGTSTDPSQPLFEVKNKDGGTVMVIYPDSVHFYVTDPGAKATAQGGFAVSGRSSSKAATSSNFMRVTPKNYFIGHESGYHNTTGVKNIFLGYRAGYTNTTGIRNVFIGDNAGYSSTGSKNICIGDSAGSHLAGADDNIFIGSWTGRDNTYGGQNVFVGSTAGVLNTTGYGNTYIGWGAGTNNNGANNVMIGYWSGLSAYNTSNNLYIGQGAGLNNTGNDNIFLGYLTTNNGAYSNNIFIGNEISNVFNGNNKLVIEGAGDVTTPLIYGEFDNNILQVNGKLGVGVSPSFKLDVKETTSSALAGVFRKATSPAALGNPYINIGGAEYTSGQYNTIGFGYISNSVPAIEIGMITTSTAGSQKGDFIVATRDVTTNTVPTERFRVTSAGRVDVSGTFRIGGGTVYTKVQSGTGAVGVNGTGGVKTATITFPSAFSSTPMVLVTVRGENFTDVFVVTTRNITTTSFQVNVYRADSPGGIWGQNLQVDWQAWN